MTKSDNFSNIIPIMALYALAGYRLLPALQKSTALFSMLRLIPLPMKICTRFNKLKFANNLMFKSTLDC